MFYNSYRYKVVSNICNMYRQHSQMVNNLKIYVLKCLQNKYYVGKTTNFARRYDEHLSGSGSVWTKKYRPIDIAEVISDADKYDEDKYVWKYMEKYGIENVRGGSYSQVVLPPELVKCAQKHIGSASDLCFRCNESGHFIQDCPSGSFNNKRTREEVDDSPNSIEELPFSKISKINKINSNSSYIRTNSNCFRCGRKGHWSRNCNEKTHLNGRKL